MALSSTEAEYMAVTDASKEAIWLRRLYQDIHSTMGQLVPPQAPHPQSIRVDNNGAIELAKNQKNHERSKHIDIKHHFIREAVESRLIKLTRVESSKNTADIFTKALSVELHQRHMRGLGVGAI